MWIERTYPATRWPGHPLVCQLSSRHSQMHHNLRNDGVGYKRRTKWTDHKMQTFYSDSIQASWPVESNCGNAFGDVNRNCGGHCSWSSKVKAQWKWRGCRDEETYTCWTTPEDRSDPASFCSGDRDPEIGYCRSISWSAKSRNYTTLKYPSM